MCLILLCLLKLMYIEKMYYSNNYNESFSVLDHILFEIFSLVNRIYF